MYGNTQTQKETNDIRSDKKNHTGKVEGNNYSLDVLIPIE